MGERINDGGPAFPLENPRQLEDGELFKQFPGMSLRQWFAGQALLGLLANPAPVVNESGHPVRKGPDLLARGAYQHADAMLAVPEACAAVPAPDGYTDAFYEIAALLGIGAKPYSPKEAFERDIKPRLQALLAAERGGA